MSTPIRVKFDNSLPDEHVEKILYPSSTEEGGNNSANVSEIKITGTFTPLVKFNNKVLPWQDVLSMNLSCTDFTPTLSLSFIDRCNIIMMLDTPGPDNNVIIEILSRFDKIYKKIKLSFYITRINHSNDSREINVFGIYNCKGLNDSNLESFGKITTYKFYEQIAQRLKLGLCSNIDDSDDERWIYMNSNTFRESLEQEVGCGGSPEVILDSWIDWWNNINIVNLKDLYGGTPDTLDKVWVMTNFINVDPKSEETPEQIDPIITNDYRQKMNPLYSSSFTTQNSNSENSISGTDRAINTFDLSGGINQSLLIQDGSGVKSSIFTKFYYNGEYFSEDNNGEYLFQQDAITTFKQKISNNIISIEIPQPCLGLMRGGKVNLDWYDDSNMNPDVYREGQEMQSNTEIESGFDEDNIDLSRPGSMVLNRKISGQYYIVGTSIKYERSDSEKGPVCNLYQELILSRPVETFNYNDITKDK